MRVFKFILSILFTGLFLLSCDDNDRTIKEANTLSKDLIPKDSLAFYLPMEISNDSTLYISNIDSFILNWYSSALYSFKEPILYKNYIGHDLYRFLWLRSFDRPVVFSLNKKGTIVWLNYKILDIQPLFYNIRYGNESSMDTFYEKRGYKIEIDDKGDKLIRADRRATIVENRIIKLSEKEWNRFEYILNKIKYWDMIEDSEGGGADGAEWILEAHLKNKYKYVVRWSPTGNIEDAGLYLIKLSRLKEEIY